MKMRLLVSAAILLAIAWTATAADKDLGRIMPLGDSITKGAPAGAYRDPLFTLLKESGCAFRFVGSLTENPTAALTAAGQDRHEGHSGMGMSWIDDHLKELLAANPPDRLLLAIGANDVGGATVPELRARMDKLVADVFALRDAARLNLGYTELRAPIDGVVGNRSVQNGAYAATGAQLLSLVPSHGLWIDANFKESQLALVRPGLPATVELDAVSGKIFHGHVVSIAPATGAQFSVLPPENATGNFTKVVQRVTVRIGLDEEAAILGQLRPGLSVTAKVNGKPRL